MNLFLIGNRVIYLTKLKIRSKYISCMTSGVVIRVTNKGVYIENEINPKIRVFRAFRNIKRT